MICLEVFFPFVFCLLLIRLPYTSTLLEQEGTPPCSQQMPRRPALLTSPSPTCRSMAQLSLVEDITDMKVLWWMPGDGTAHGMSARTALFPRKSHVPTFGDGKNKAPTGQDMKSGVSEHGWGTGGWNPRSWVPVGLQGLVLARLQ